MIHIIGDGDLTGKDLRKEEGNDTYAIRSISVGSSASALELLTTMDDEGIELQGDRSP
jgi:hypothetical protein